MFYKGLCIIKACNNKKTEVDARNDSAVVINDKKIQKWDFVGMVAPS